MQKKRTWIMKANDCHFVCAKGHHHTSALFHQVKKGKWSMTVCAALLTLVCGITFIII